MVADLAFGAASSAVQRFDVGDVGAVGGVVGDVGEQYLQTPSISVAEVELRAGPAVFAAGDEAAAFRPVRQVHEVGDLGYVGALNGLGPVGADRRLPAFVGNLGDGLCYVDAEAVADAELHAALSARL